MVNTICGKCVCVHASVRVKHPLKSYVIWEQQGGGFVFLLFILIQSYSNDFQEGLRIVMQRHCEP